MASSIVKGRKWARGFSSLFTARRKNRPWLMVCRAEVGSWRTKHSRTCITTILDILLTFLLIQEDWEPFIEFCAHSPTAT